MEKGEYPNPLLHIKEFQKTEAKNKNELNKDKKLLLQDGVKNDKEKFEVKNHSNDLSKKINETLLHYLELKKHQKEIEKEIAAKKDFLEKTFKENNISEVGTNIGTLKKIDDHWIIEL